MNMEIAKQKLQSVYESVYGDRSFNLNVNRMAKGNSKNSKKNVLIFNLTPGEDGSCRQTCSSCYAMKAERMYVNVRYSRKLNFELAKNHREALEYILCCQLEKDTKRNIVRIHESGDFFSQEYIDMWERIMRKFPEKRFYTYTKNIDFFNFDSVLSLNNFNIVNSYVELSDGTKTVNYGNEEKIEIFKKLGYFVCPYTGSNKMKYGEDCNYCIYHSNVVFHQH